MFSNPSSPITFRQVRASFLRSDASAFRDVLSEQQIQQAAMAEQLSFGDRPGNIYSVAVTLWAFIAQVLSEQKSCVAAVARVLVLVGYCCSANTGAYCKARGKLSERFLERLACETSRQLEDHVPDRWRWRRRRVILIDGSTLSMPDTPANQRAYPQARTQKLGVGFPILRWVALIDLATAAVLGSAFGPYRGKETGETALFRQLVHVLEKEDVLVADRYFCTYWIVALCLALGVDVVFRKHQLRHTDFRTGRRLGRDDHLVTWTKPARPDWMSEEEYQTVRDTLTLRETRTKINKRGCRIRDLIVISTLVDAEEVPKEELFDLYHQRWNAEVDLRSIKTHMKMDILRGKSPDMVRKEIWTHLLAYNLVRKVMAEAALKHNLTPRQLSFAGAVQTLNEFRNRLLTASDEDLPALSAAILKAIATHRVGNRPDRVEPRKVKRRPKSYPLMTKPRAEERAACQ